MLKDDLGSRMSTCERERMRRNSCPSLVHDYVFQRMGMGQNSTSLHPRLRYNPSKNRSNQRTRGLIRNMFVKRKKQLWKTVASNPWEAILTQK